MARPRVAVATSGGRDSTALLHCTVRCARDLGLDVVALHVHHGLAADADAWWRQVAAQSRRWGAAFAGRRLAGAPGRGESVEAWARRERYGALAEMAAAAGCSLVLLAHHQRDQAETWLLQALRGAGPAGLSAMPDLALRAGLTWARPWLAMPREAIETYVRRHRLRHVDDASNSDPRFARNRLRLQVWPVLHQAFPAAEVALVAAAARAQEARALAAEIATTDLPPLRLAQALDVQAWLGLPPARRRNALRAWLAGLWAGGVPESLVTRLFDQLPGSACGRWPAPPPGAELRLHRGQLSLVQAEAPRATHQPGVMLDLSVCGEVALPDWGGRFVVEDAVAQGAGPALLRVLCTVARSGGERFRLAPRAAARSLKQQFQALGVPPWQRVGPLLVTPQGRLVFVPGLGIEGLCQATPGQPQRALRWLPDAAATGQGQRPD